MKMLTKISNLIYKVEKVIVIFLVGIMFSSLTLGVLFRYFLKMPLHWSGEIAIFSLVWLTLIGGSMNIKNNESASVTFVVDKLTGKSLQTFKVLSTLILLIFSLFVLYYSVRWISSPYIAFEKSLAIGIPMIYPYLAIPIGFLFITIHTLNAFLKVLMIGERGEKV